MSAPASPTTPFSFQHTPQLPEIVAELSTYFELCPGDLIFTGTPAGVGPLAVGDLVEAHIDGLPQLSIRIGPPVTGTAAA